MAAKTNNAEGGSNGVVPTSSDTGSGDAFTTVTNGGVAGKVEYTTTQKAHGTLAYRYYTRGTGEVETLIWDNGADITADTYGRFYLYIDNINVLTRLLQYRSTSAGGVVLAYITAINSGAGYTVNIRHGTDASSAWASPVLTLSTWYRVEWYVDMAAGTTSQMNIRLRVYLGDDTTEVTSGDSGNILTTQNGVATTLRTVRHGQSTADTNRPSTTGFVYMDDLVAYATSFPGASAQQLLVPSADSVDGAWTNQAGSNVNMYQSIDEGSAAGSTADYIQSELGPSASVNRMKIASGTTPGSGQKLYRAYIGKNLTGGATINMVIRLYEGGGDVAGAGTLKDTFTFNNVDAAGTQLGTMIGTYTDWTNIYREWEATQV